MAEDIAEQISALDVASSVCVLTAYDYVVNGKPALEWVMERQSVTTGIVNDANRWATETMGDAKYPLALFLRIITVSLETLKMVNGLRKLDF